MWLRTVEDSEGNRVTGVGHRPFLAILSSTPKNQQPPILIFERKLTDQEIEYVNECGDRGITF